MSKDKITPAMTESHPTASWGYGFVVSENTPDYLIGKLLTLIEVMGLEERQEKSTKDLISQTIRTVFWDGIYISPETHNEIRNRHERRSKEATLGGMPVSAI